MHQKIGTKSPTNSERYEAVPTTVMCPGVPTPQEGTLNRWSTEGDRLISGVRTLVTSLTKADRLADELLCRCQHRVRAGQPWAILELLDINPEFIKHPWVRKAYFRFSASGRLRRSPGRPRGRYKVHPLCVLGLVEYLISTGEAKTREKAFGKLEEFGILSYVTAKRVFTKAINDKRFRAIALTFPELAWKLNKDELAELNDAEMLTPGANIIRTVEDDRFGPITITFEATGGNG